MHAPFVLQADIIVCCATDVASWELSLARNLCQCVVVMGAEAVPELDVVTSLGVSTRWVGLVW